jgi:hypothetical protein
MWHCVLFVAFPHPIHRSTDVPCSPIPVPELYNWPVAPSCYHILSRCLTSAPEVVRIKSCQDYRFKIMYVCMYVFIYVCLTTSMEVEPKNPPRLISQFVINQDPELLSSTTHHTIYFSNINVNIIHQIFGFPSCLLLSV